MYHCFFLRFFIQPIYTDYAIRIILRKKHHIKCLIFISNGSIWHILTFYKNFREVNMKTRREKLLAPVSLWFEIMASKWRICMNLFHICRQQDQNKKKDTPSWLKNEDLPGKKQVLSFICMTWMAMSAIVIVVNFLSFCLKTYFKLLHFFVL